MLRVSAVLDAGGHIPLDAHCPFFPFPAIGVPNQKFKCLPSLIALQPAKSILLVKTTYKTGFERSVDSMSRAPASEVDYILTYYMVVESKSKIGAGPNKASS